MISNFLVPVRPAKSQNKQNQGKYRRFYLVTFEENYGWYGLFLETNSRAVEKCAIYQLQCQKDSLRFFSLGFDGSCKRVLLVLDLFGDMVSSCMI